jgi:hypothetical protein
MEPIRPIGRPQDGPAPVPAIRRLTPKEREEAARERQRRRRARAGAPQRPGGAGGTVPPGRGGTPPAGGPGSLDVRA